MATAGTIAPLPPANVPITAPQQEGKGSGGISQAYMQWLASVNTTVTTGNFPGLSVNGNAVLTIAGGQTLVGGFNEKPFSLGTPTNGSTVTPNPSDNLKQTLINNVAGFTIAATAQVGDVELYITNGASAGTIAFSGFTKQFTGDALDTTNTHEFVVFLYAFKNDAGVLKTAYLIKAMQ